MNVRSGSLFTILAVAAFYPGHGASAEKPSLNASGKSGNKASRELGDGDGRHRLFQRGWSSTSKSGKSKSSKSTDSPTLFPTTSPTLFPTVSPTECQGWSKSSKSSSSWSRRGLRRGLGDGEGEGWSARRARDEEARGGSSSKTSKSCWSSKSWSKDARFASRDAGHVRRPGGGGPDVDPEFGGSARGEGAPRAGAGREIDGVGTRRQLSGGGEY